MIFPRDDVQQAYAQIQADANGTTGQSVVVFSSMDCDSLCASRILKDILNAELIKYSLKAVNGFEDLKESAIDHITNNEDLRSIILINCGSSIDIKEYLGLGEGGPIKVYIFDSHRPVHLENAFSPEQVWLFDSDGTKEEVEEIQEIYFNYVKFFEGQEDEDGDSDESDEESDSSEDEERVAKRAREDPRRLARREARHRIRRYYERSSWATPASMFLWSLAVCVSKDSLATLWLSIVGMTDAYVHERLRQEDYDMLVSELQGDVLRLGGSDTVEPEEIEEGVMAPTIDSGRVIFEEEYRLMLYRHWSLYDSMFHSMYVASRLGIWREPGRARLDRMFAKLGIPLDQCRQRFQWMAAEYKDVLRDRLRDFKDEFGLQELFYGSFSRSLPFRGNMSAADMVYAINALLLNPPNPESVTADQDGANVWEKNFQNALDALDEDGQSRLQAGIEDAKELQRLIVREGVTLLEKQAIKLAGSFSYAYIDKSSDQRQLNNPSTLIQLALFLVESMLLKHKSRKPFVLCALNEESDPETYTVVGVMGSMRYRDIQANNFGMRFRKVAEKTGVRMRQDGFETAIMQVLRADIGSFMEYLHLELGDIAH